MVDPQSGGPFLPLLPSPPFSGPALPSTPLPFTVPSPPLTCLPFPSIPYLPLLLPSPMQLGGSGGAPAANVFCGYFKPRKRI